MPSRSTTLGFVLCAFAVPGFIVLSQQNQCRNEERPYRTTWLKYKRCKPASTRVCTARVDRFLEGDALNFISGFPAEASCSQTRRHKEDALSGQQHSVTKCKGGGDIVAQLETVKDERIEQQARSSKEQSQRQVSHALRPTLCELRRLSIKITQDLGRGYR